MHIQLKLNTNISGVQGLLSSHKVHRPRKSGISHLRQENSLIYISFLFPSLSTFTEYGRVLVGYILTKNALSTISGVDHHQE